WWCSHDVDRSLADFPPLEYSLGLIDAEGRVKPIGRAFADVAAELRARPVPPSVRHEAVVVDVDERDVPLSRADCAPGAAVSTAWSVRAQQDGRPRVATSRLAEAPAAPAARGIERLRRVEPGQPGGYSARPDPGSLGVNA